MSGVTNSSPAPPKKGTGGGGVWSKVSYQNSAMSAAVDCYIQYKADGTTPAAVYEPVRNNYVRLHTYTDKFPFDNASCYDNTINDVDLLNVASDVVIQGCQLETMRINGGGLSGLQLINHLQKGNYGLTAPNGGEIYIVGINCVLTSNVVGSGNTSSYIDSMGAGCLLTNCTLEPGVSIDYKSSNNCSLYGCTFASNSGMEFNSDGGYCAETNFCCSSYMDVYNIYCTKNFLANKSYVNAVKEVENCYVGVNSQVNTTNGSTSESTIGDNVTYAPSSDQTNVNIQNINGTSYELGVTAGAVTAVAI